MKKLILVAVGFFLLIGYMAITENKKTSEPIYCKYVDEISHEFLVLAKTKYGLTCSGSGGALMDRVNVISLSLDSREQDFDIKRARRLIIDCSEDYLERVNNNEEIRPYLSHFPFTEKGIRFSISFRNPQDDAIKLAFLSQGNVVYSVIDPDQKPYVTKHKETYEEAREIVMAERRSTM